MADLIVTCVRSDGSDDDYRIEGIGSGRSWYHAIDTAIYNIECGVHRYYTTHCGVKAKVVVQVHAVTKRKYLTTESDGYSGNNLSELQSCPLAA